MVAGLIAMEGLHTGGRALERYIEEERNIELGYFTDQNVFSRLASELRGRLGNKPNIVLISIDTLRADYVKPEIMPGFCAWSAGAALQLTNAHAVSTWTLPSHLSMLTGLPPHEHRVETPTDVIPENIQMIQEELMGRGYETVSFNGGGFIKKYFGFSKGFNYWQDEYAEGEDSFSEAEKYISTYESGKPLFLFLHTYDVHDYAHPSTKREERKDFEGAYKEGVKSFDEKLTRMIIGILSSSLSDNLRMIITSDHGEGFGETYDLYGREIVSVHHGDFPCPSQVEIPFVVYDSQNPLRGLSDKLVGLDDVYHTIRVWAGIERMNERYVLSEKEREFVLSETIPNFIEDSDERRTAKIVGDGQYVETFVKKTGRTAPTDKAKLPPEVVENLKGLGYLQ